MSTVLKPGSTGYILFEVMLTGQYIDGVIGTESSTIYRNGIGTSLVPTITNPETGKYLVTFPIPDYWEDYDTVSASFSIQVNGFTAKLHKEVGTVLSRSMLEDLWSLLMLNPNRSVTHKQDKIVIDEGSPNQIVINLTRDEINKTVTGTRE